MVQKHDFQKKSGNHEMRKNNCSRLKKIRPIVPEVVYVVRFASKCSTLFLFFFCLF